ncbi:hypothetical protein J4E91_007471 [Alternaria rosae]|nr:hypothetical protein J4E91_007471 [Alternaria rosae]
MPPQRSRKVAPRHGLDGKPKRPARGQRGYRKHRSGLLNVEPIGSEVELANINARDSPLLRLPAEIRNQIFSLALGGSAVKMPSRVWPMAKPEEHLARWNLLRVCRQVYVETAMIAYTTIPFCFAAITDVTRYLRTFRLQHVHAIHFGASLSEMRMAPRNNACARFLRGKSFRALQKVKITLSMISMTPAGESAAVARVKEMVEAYLPGKQIEVCKGTYFEHLAYWEES